MEIIKKRKLTNFLIDNQNINSINNNFIFMIKKNSYILFLIVKKQSKIIQINLRVSQNQITCLPFFDKTKIPTIIKKDEMIINIIESTN